MALPSIKQTLLDEIDKLTIEQQAHVLEYTRSLQPPLPPTTPDEELSIDPAELAAVEAATAEDRKKIDWDEW